MKILYALIIFLCFNVFLFPQNFFPIHLNNRYQYKETYTHSTPYYNNYVITEDTLYDGKVFYKFGYKYLHYDTLENKLYILQATGINLAIDFTAPADSAVDLNFDGGTTRYVSRGT